MGANASSETLSTSRKQKATDNNGVAESALGLSLAQDVYQETPNIFYALVVRVDARTYLLLGEYHTAIDIDDFAWLKRLRKLCHTTPVDIFVEDNFWYRRELRERHKTFEEIDQDLQTLQHGNDSLNLHRIVSQVACDTFRVHAVDVRDQGFMGFYFTIVPKIQGVADEGATGGTYSCNGNNQMCQDLVYCYSVTLETNLTLVASMAKKNIRKGLRNTQETATVFVNEMDAQIKQAINTKRLPKVWKAYSKLVDMYMLPRMCRADNNNLCIFYGGANHAKRTGLALQNMPGAKVLFESERGTQS